MRTVAMALAMLAMTGPAAAAAETIQSQLQELYRTPVERLTDPQTGAVAFLPG